jgi:signal recognition particle receptor subunit beta
VIGITRTDLGRSFRMDTVRQAVRRCGQPIPVFTFDARDREQTSHLVRALLLSLD